MISSLSCRYSRFFKPPFGSYFDLMRATASYSYEALVATAIEPFAADCDVVSTIGCESRLERIG